MKIVFASHTPIGGPFVVGSHHLAREFAAMGHAVAHIAMPLSPAHILRHADPLVQMRFRSWRDGGEWRSDGVFNYTPLCLAPWQVSGRLPRALNLSLLCVPPIAAKLACNGFADIDLLLIDEPRLCGIEARLKPAVMVYRATDLYRDMPGRSSMDGAERHLARVADVLVGTSSPVVDHLTRLAPWTDPILLENGVEFERFASPMPAPAEWSAIDRPRLIYTGAIDDRFDCDLVAALARAHPAWHFPVIGPAAAEIARRFAAIPNLHFLGAKPYAELPAFLQHADIALLPLSDQRANQGRSPMKLFEYGAAGLPVVASATNELTRRALPFVRLARDAEGFCREIDRLLGDPDLRTALSRAASAAARMKGWHQLAKLLLVQIGARLPSARRGRIAVPA